MADGYWRRACLDAVDSVKSATSLESSSGFIMAVITVSSGSDAATPPVKRSLSQSPFDSSCCRSSRLRHALRSAAGCTFDGGAWTSTTGRACGSITAGSPRSCALVAAPVLCLLRHGRSGFATTIFPIGNQMTLKLETISFTVPSPRMR